MYQIEILLIDDNLDDNQMMRDTLSEYKLKNNLNIVSNAYDAQAFLSREMFVPQPDLILLNPYFTQSSGQSIFDALREDAQLRDVPVVMLTSTDIRPELPQHLTPPNGFVTKPFNFKQFIDVVKSIQSFRVAIVTTL